MKTTLAKIKSLINKRADVCGWSLSKSNPYFGNEERIKYMEELIQDMKELGDENPLKRFEISDSQMKSLKNWTQNLREKYL